ncbi:MAG: amidohydrolase family protein [Ilumatobacter sp.]|uniref:metal-dependent hydrolase family protein n=1 Tax=Ilumatobacter sp. TaxID=1967498 RepID=UPI002628518B|nr:amidohydrolase family protein [Ilumatobacter sp.]MDJ0769848.1 amidohydrolase family protein [Ilumatobacter sp.]
MPTRIVADVLIPGRGAPVEQGTVVSDQGEIVYAGPTAGAPPAKPDEDVHEVPAAMPGMWDCHTHLIGMPTPNIETLATLDPVTGAARAVDDAGKVLDAGITSVRDVGGPGIRLAPAVEEGRMRGPRIHAAGRVLSTTGGHGDLHSFPLDFVHELGCNGGFSILCDGVPEVLKAVRTNLRTNAKLIKICASGGVMSEVDHPIHQQFSDEELSAIVGEAARAERIVAAHCHGKPGIMAALRAGCHTIEHGSFLDEEAADLMVETGAMYVPTRFVVDELLHQVDALPRYAYEKGQMVAGAHEQAMKIAIAKGVRIATGCDIFVSGQMYGENSREVLALINAGMTDLEAIEAATANGPETLGPQAPRTGQLIEGYDADVIAFDSNPLDDRSVWGDPVRVTHVWQRGNRVK